MAETGKFDRNADDDTPVPLYGPEPLERFNVVRALASHPFFVTVARRRYPDRPINTAVADLYHDVTRPYREAQTFPHLPTLAAAVAWVISLME